MKEFYQKYRGYIFFYAGLINFYAFINGAIQIGENLADGKPINLIIITSCLNGAAMTYLFSTYTKTKKTKSNERSSN